MLGSAVITLDPIFSGLAWAFIFGIFASTAFTLIVVPLIYYLVYRDTAARDPAPSCRPLRSVYYGTSTQCDR